MMSKRFILFLLQAMTLGVPVWARLAPRFSKHGKDTSSEAVERCTCQVRLTEFMRENPVEDLRVTSEEFECHAPETPREPAWTIQLDMDMEDDVYVSNEQAFQTDKWFMQFPCDWVVDGSLPKDKINQAYSLSTQEAEEHFDAGHRHLRRRLSNIGTQYYGIVIVNAANKINPLSAAAAEAMVQVANQQYQECSGNELELSKRDSTVVITLPKNIEQYSSYSVDDDMFKMICLYYGYSPNCEISKKRDLDHILFSLPYGLSDDYLGIWAKGSAGDGRRYSVYGGGLTSYEGQDFPGGYFVPSTIMHELGHNYRLGHALDPRQNGNYAYGDTTNHMGGGVFTKKCFNGYNYYALGWHSSQTNEVTLSPNVARRYNIKGIDDLNSGGVINIKADRYYATYNMKKGINSETGEYENQVVIYKGKDIPFGQSIFQAYFSTEIVANLGQVGDQFSVAVAGGELQIKLCSIDTTGSNGAMLSIGLGTTNCADDGLVTNPQGVESLTSGVPVQGLSAAKNDLLEFKMQFSSVPTSVTCTTSGGTGDADLMVNSMSTPQIVFTSDVNDCYSAGSSNSHSCTATNLSGPIVYVVVYGYKDFSGVTLLCTATGAESILDADQGNEEDPEVVVQVVTEEEEEEQEEPPAVAASNVLSSGVPKTNINLPSGAAVVYTMPMPSNAMSVSCFISGGGDADLYTRWDAEVDLVNIRNNKCVPWINGSNEFCEAQRLSPLGTVLHVGVHAYSEVVNVSLECSVVTA